MRVPVVIPMLPEDTMPVEALAKPSWEWCVHSAEDLRKATCEHCHKAISYGARDHLIHFHGQHYHLGCLLDKLTTLLPYPPYLSGHPGMPDGLGGMGFTP